MCPGQVRSRDPLGGRAHRAGLGFLRGAVVAAAAQVMAAPAAGALLAVPPLAFLVPLVRGLVSVTGFGLAGALGGETLGTSPRGPLAFAAGGLVGGTALLVTSPNLAGLTGFEDPRLVVAYSLVTSSVAFALVGLVGAGLLGRSVVVPSVEGFAVGGALGGLLGVGPFLAARFVPLNAPPPIVAQLLTAASGLGAVVVPLVLGGIWTAAALDGSDR